MMMSDALLRHRSDRPTLLLHLGWLALSACLLVIFGLNQWRLFADFASPCATPCADPSYLSAGEIAEMQAHGYAPSAYAAAQVALYVVFLLINAVLATLIFWRRTDEPIVRYAALSLLLWGATFPSISPRVWEGMPALALLLVVCAGVSNICFYLFLLRFPNGRFAPRWIRLVFLALALYGSLDMLPSIPAVAATGPVVAMQSLHVVFLFVLYSVIIGSHIYRYWRISTPVERQQTKWVVFGIVVGLAWGLLIAVSVYVVDPAALHGALFKAIGTGLIYLGFLLVPLSIGVAIMRARLWDIDLIISRTLIYATLTALVVALYIGLVGYLGAVLRAQNNLLISLIATGVVAVLFQPLRDRVQRSVNHLLYGERDEPYAVVARLGRRLEATLAPEAVLTTITETVAQALRLPYAAIVIDQGDRCIKAVASGQPVPNPLVLPLVYQRETVGLLILGPRGRGQPFSAADRRLLATLARQAGVAGHAVRLTVELQNLMADLQRSREQLVTAREEERRRLRRDLHDGLGPALAGFSLSVGAARNLLTRDPIAADQLLVQLGKEIETAVGDIKRLVYNLRPPALDELGLVGAIRARATHDTGVQAAGAVQIQVEAPEQLPPLPAAVEVAAYRIVQEALTNVLRHAQARHCVVRLTCDTLLRVEICDDGIGLGPAGTPDRAGVGLRSMHERADELGGRCVVELGADGGTCVRAWFPIGVRQEAAGEREGLPS
jgi:signal transduction histidine kinase